MSEVEREEQIATLQARIAAQIAAIEELTDTAPAFQLANTLTMLQAIVNSLRADNFVVSNTMSNDTLQTSEA